MFRTKRRVRIHQVPGGPTIEGIQLSRRPIAGHYVVILARTLQDAEDGAVREVPLDAERVEIPKERVTAIEVLAS